MKTKFEFNQTKQNQFIDEVYFVNKKKEFNGTLTDSIKGSITIKKLDSILQDKRKAYNYLIANTFEQYGICPDDLYSKLDKIWPKTSLNDYGYGYLSKAAKIIKPFNITNTVPLGIAHLSFYQFAVKTKWEQYKTSVLLFAKNYSSNILNDEEE